VLAVVNREDGADLVRPLLGHAMISAVNAAEVHTKLTEYGEETVQRGRALLDLLHVVPFDTAQARRTGELRPNTRKAGLSLGDRACLALGMELDAEVYTCEGDWTKVDLPCTIRIIRGLRKSVS
jgi:PIN domain nuclease of toxin-antitoxin system